MLYYRVTGKPFNSVKPPSLRTAQRNDWVSEVQFDPDVGGDGVAARMIGLDLAESRLDGHIDPASALGYWEWTLIFSNEATVQREARMQVMLPENGVVSRLTLWVEGEPQEAAFGRVADVKAAYRSVAVVQRRDPVLVRWVAPDRVMVQCFPVPPGGEMKIRLGITAALGEEGKLALPRIVERNFGLTEEAQAHLWVQAKGGRVVMEGLGQGATSGSWNETHGEIPVEVLIGERRFVRCVDGEGEPVIWTEDPFAEPKNRIVVRRKTTADIVPVEHLFVVVDGSIALRDWGEAVAAGLENLPSSLKVKVFVAGDSAQEIAPEDLARFRFEGGRDNREALAKAIEAAVGFRNSAVVWVHGSQPVDFGPVAEIVQFLERGFNRPQLWALGLENGPNRILERLGNRALFHTAGEISGAEGVSAFFGRLAGSRPVTRHEWEMLPEGNEPPGKEVWDQLARWRVWQEVKEASSGKSGEPRAVAEKAARYQLVTPWSGAVVLERKEQYKEFGLEQVDASATPSMPVIPEPGTLELAALGIASLLLRRRRRRSG